MLCSEFDFIHNLPFCELPFGLPINLLLFFRSAVGSAGLPPWDLPVGRWICRFIIKICHLARSAVWPSRPAFWTAVGTVIWIGIGALPFVSCRHLRFRYALNWCWCLSLLEGLGPHRWLGGLSSFRRADEAERRWRLRGLGAHNAGLDGLSSFCRAGVAERCWRLHSFGAHNAGLGGSSSFRRADSRTALETARVRCP